MGTWLPEILKASNSKDQFVSLLLLKFHHAFPWIASMFAKLPGSRSTTLWGSGTYFAARR